MMTFEWFLNNYVYSYNTIGNFFIGFGLAFLMQQFLVFVTTIITVIDALKYGRSISFHFGPAFRVYGMPGLLFLALGLSLKSW